MVPAKARRRGYRMTTYDPRRALELLRLGTQQRHARFREGQEAAIRHVANGAGPLLLVQKTGWGKSNVYFIAVKLLREAGFGPALLISPLLALMRNQIEAAERMGVRAVTINSDNKDEWEVVEVQIRRDAIDVLLISPERLANERFVADVLAPIADRIALLVIDEAHCISDWGHDFRPDYRRIETDRKNAPAEPAAVGNHGHGQRPGVGGSAEGAGRLAGLAGTLADGAAGRSKPALAAAPDHAPTPAKPSASHGWRNGWAKCVAAESSTRSPCGTRSRWRPGCNRAGLPWRPIQDGPGIVGPSWSKRCWTTGSRHLLPPRRSAWGSTSPICRSCSTTRRRDR